MTDPIFRAKVRPVLNERAAKLVGIYEAVPGSTAPGCCPEALAAVLRFLVDADSELNCFSLLGLADDLCGNNIRD